MTTARISGWRSLSRRFSYRLVAVVVSVSVPLLVVLAVLLTSEASGSLTAAGQAKGVGVARAVALRVEDWLSERRESLTVIADTHRRSPRECGRRSGSGPGGQDVRRFFVAGDYRPDR